VEFFGNKNLTNPENSSDVTTTFFPTKKKNKYHSFPASPAHTLHRKQKIERTFMCKYVKKFIERKKSNCFSIWNLTRKS
jgi:hypothetical protein